MPEAPESLEFLTAVAALATRLAVDAVIVYSLTYHSLSFGSWELEAGRRKTRIRVTWEGKDRHLTVATAQLLSGSTARDWQLAEEHDYRKRRVAIGQLLGSVEAAMRAHAGLD